MVDAQNLSNVTFGESNSLDVITWNIENFPKNGQQTIDSVAVIIQSLDADVIALQEIMNVSDFNNLLSLLPNYSGYCSSGSSRKMAFIYKSNLTVNNIYNIFSSQTYNFAGRAPIVISLNYNGENIEIINSHLKCCGDGILDTNDISDEENRRYRAMNMIKDYIDNNLQSSKVIFLGDLNDELQDPFANNVFRNIFSDSTNYYFADLYISNSSSANWSYPNWPSDIDHILVTNELFNYFTNSNVSTIRIDDYLVGGWSAYDNIISDHRPVGISLNFLTLGCTDNNAVNYDPLATLDDSSCVYCDLSYSYVFSDPSSLISCDGWIAITSVVTSNPPFTISWQNGSTQSYIFNLCTGSYIVNIQDGAGCNIFDTIQIGIVNGCTDPLACNYDSSASVDDGSCIYIYGCTDPLANNYDTNACIDDGSCNYTVSCSSPSITGLGVANILHNRATMLFNNMNTASCRVDQLRIKYREVGTNAWSQKNMGSPTGYDPVTGICNSTSRTDKQLLGLSSNTTYEWQMRVWYCETGVTPWVNGPNFTTLDDCPNVGNLAVTTPTSTKATFTWDDSNGPYSFVRLQGRVDTVGSSFFNIGGVGVTYGTYTKNKNGLVPGTSYRAKSRTWCDPNGGAYKAPSWTSFIYFTMPGSVRLEESTIINDLDIYPNPSRDVFNISFKTANKQDITLRIRNIVGEEIYTEELNQFDGTYTKAISLENYPKAVYFLEINTTEGTINKKIALQ